MVRAPGVIVTVAPESFQAAYALSVTTPEIVNVRAMSALTSSRSTGVLERGPSLAVESLSELIGEGAVGVLAKLGCDGLPPHDIARSAQSTAETERRNFAIEYHLFAFDEDGKTRRYWYSSRGLSKGFSGVREGPTRMPCFSTCAHSD